MNDLLTQLGPIQRHAGGLHALRVGMAPGMVMDGHRHDEPTIVLVLSGELDVTENGEHEVHECAGTLRLCPARIKRRIRTTTGADCLVVSCHPSHAVARHMIWRRVSDDRSVRYHVGSDALSLTYYVCASPKFGPEFETLCIDLLTKLVRDREPIHVAPAWLTRALRALGETDGRRGACRAVAKDLGLHPVHLARVVRWFTGLTPRDYLRRERIIRASRMLRSTHESLSRVAHHGGFADHSHFTREFIRRYGHAPSNDRELGTPDVVSIQASDFPAVHVGRLSSGGDDRQGESAWDGRAPSKD